MKTGYIKKEGLQIKVEIVGEREIFGRLEYLVTPVYGVGEIWVLASNVSEEQPSF